MTRFYYIFGFALSTSVEEKGVDGSDGEAISKTGRSPKVTCNPTRGHRISSFSRLSPYRPPVSVGKTREKCTFVSFAVDGNRPSMKLAMLFCYVSEMSEKYQKCVQLGV